MIHLKKELDFGFELHKVNFKNKTGESLHLKPSEESKFYGKITNLQFIYLNDRTTEDFAFTVDLSKTVVSKRDQNKIIKEFVKMIKKKKILRKGKIEIRRKKTKKVSFNVFFRLR